jgi:2Fe-2S ferredoxin
MPTINFIDFKGNQTGVDTDIGSSVMAAASQNDVVGIDADCGGACACVTCNAYTDTDWVERVGEPDELESEMLEVAEGVESNLRLACQLKVTDELDGLVVTTPESQF